MSHQQFHETVAAEQQWREQHDPFSSTPTPSKDSTTMTSPVPKVYAAINRVQAQLAATGIGKDRKNKEQGFQYRGIDEVFNALSPLLAAAGLCVLPRILSRTVSERTTASGKATFNVVVEAEFDFVCAEDGSRHVVRTFGEALDMADKATNKAMSAAYKYAALQAFAIPTEGSDHDADAHTPDAGRPAPAAPIPASPRQAEREAEARRILGTIASAADMVALKANVAAAEEMLGEEHWAAIGIAAKQRANELRRAAERARAPATTTKLDPDDDPGAGTNPASTTTEGKTAA